MWIQFGCLIPSTFVSAIPQTNCAINPSRNFCPFVPQFHLPAASSLHSRFEPFLTQTSTWTLLHNVEKKSRCLCSPTAPLASHQPAPCRFLSTETFKPRFRHLSGSPSAVTLGQGVLTMQEEPGKGRLTMTWTEINKILKKITGELPTEICVQAKSDDKNA